MTAPRIAISCFSGTGNTRLCADAYASAFRKQGASATVLTMEKTIRHEPAKLPEFDLLGIGYPVHCFDAPAIVLDFIRRLPTGEGRGAFLFKSMADILGNGGTTAHLRKLLEHKGYRVFHEGLFVMPSNWVTTCRDDVAAVLYANAKRRAKHFVTEILSGTERFIPFKLSGFLLHLLGPFERWRSRLGSVFFRATPACTSCTECVSVCPTRSISLRDGRPRFGWNCLCCMRCFYKCPQGAIKTPPFNFVIIKPGYDAPSRAATEITPETMPKRYRRYLRNEDLK